MVSGRVVEIETGKLGLENEYRAIDPFLKSLKATIPKRLKSSFEKILDFSFLPYQKDCVPESISMYRVIKEIMYDGKHDMGCYFSKDQILKAGFKSFNKFSKALGKLSGVWKIIKISVSKKDYLKEQGYFAWIYFSLKKSYKKHECR